MRSRSRMLVLRALRIGSVCGTRVHFAPTIVRISQRRNRYSTRPSARRTQGGFELSFAAFLEAAPDVAVFAKNYLAVGFKLDYVKADGDLSNYTPDFIVRITDGTIWIIETKGREEIDVPQKNGAAAANGALTPRPPALTTTT